MPRLEAPQMVQRSNHGDLHEVVGIDQIPCGVGEPAMSPAPERRKVFLDEEVPRQRVAGLGLAEQGRGVEGDRSGDLSPRLEAAQGRTLQWRPGTPGGGAPPGVLSARSRGTSAREWKPPQGECRFREARGRSSRGDSEAVGDQRASGVAVRGRRTWPWTRAGGAASTLRPDSEQRGSSSVSFLTKGMQGPRFRRPRWLRDDQSPPSSEREGRGLAVEDSSLRVAYHQS